MPSLWQVRSSSPLATRYHLPCYSRARGFPKMGKGGGLKGGGGQVVGDGGDLTVGIGHTVPHPNRVSQDPELEAAWFH